jgi:hypothetical protein
MNGGFIIILSGISEIQNLGIVCTVDLFPVPGLEPTRKDTKDHGQRRMIPAPSNQTPYTSSLPSQFPQESFTFVTSTPYSSPQASSSTARPFAPVHSQQFQPPTGPEPIIHRVGDHPIYESSRLTHFLVGATFVQPANVDYQGKKALMFVFAVCRIYHKSMVLLYLHMLFKS